MLSAPIGFLTAQAVIIKPEAYARGNALRDMLDAGVLAANHSDAPQANLWPWWGLEATLTRGFPGHPEIEEFNADQAITLEETLRVHTINGAYVLGLDQDTGSIAVGKYADMIVLDRNLFDTPVDEIHQTQVERTIFKGNVVHGSGGAE